MEPVLLAQAVRKTFAEREATVVAVDDVSLTVHEGEFVAVMGPSGCGKSTLLAIAGGLDNPDQGTVVVDGLHVGDVHGDDAARLRRERVGFVFQDFNLVTELTAVENVALPRELSGVSVRDARSEAAHLLDDMGLSDLVHRYPDEMSGGQRQRVAIARALSGRRRLLLADEPTGALDSHSGTTVLDAIRACADRGVACVVVTHDPTIADRADRIVRMNDGRIVADHAKAPA